MLHRLPLSAVLLLLALASTALAQVHVEGYTRRDGTSVQPHYRSAPDGNPSNNWSTRGNLNPYTGQMGTRDPVHPLPWYQPPPPVIPTPRTLSPYEAGYLYRR